MVVVTSLFGVILMLSNCFIDNCVDSLKYRIESIFDPKNSILIGCSSFIKNISITYPLTAYSPVVVTKVSLL